MANRAIAAVLLCALLAAGPAAAQTSYPEQAIRILVGFRPAVRPISPRACSARNSPKPGAGRW